MWQQRNQLIGCSEGPIRGLENSFLCIEATQCSVFVLLVSFQFFFLSTCRIWIKWLKWVWCYIRDPQGPPSPPGTPQGPPAAIFFLSISDSIVVLLRSFFFFLQLITSWFPAYFRKKVKYPLIQMGAHCVYECMYHSKKNIYTFFFFFPIRRQPCASFKIFFFFFTIDHMVHSSCLKKKVKP